MSYFDQLYNASYNGVSFAVETAEGMHGRRVAMHNYPFRDGGYVEDLGKKMPRIEIRGFLVGDDVIAQRDFLIAVCERPGPGILIHPSRGIMVVSLVDFRISESAKHGRQIIIDFSFVQGGGKLFPTRLTSTLASILSQVGILNSAAASDFVSQVAGPLADGAQVVSSGVETISTFAAIGGATVKSTSNILNLTSSIPGSFGRFSNGNTGSSTGSVFGGVSSIGAIAAQVSALSSGAALARSNTAAAGASMTSTAGGL